MDLIKGLLTRQSIRDFLPKKIPKDQIITILEASMQAPSAGNQQPWEFFIIEDQFLKEKIDMIHPHAKMAQFAPVVIMICGNIQKESNKGFWPLDCAAATENLLLAAYGLGLGSVWCGIYPLKDRIEGFQKLFRLPIHIVPFALIPIGYPQQQKLTKKRFDPKNVHGSKWNEPYFSS